MLPLDVRSGSQSRVVMDGLLVVDKPSGPTSHDVVARMRRLLQERRIGHTGTLDPMASGVLPLLVGKATRLGRFMSGEVKQYDAVIRLGYATDTRDATGRALGPGSNGPWPDRDAIERALEPFRGTFRQQPPAFSAKKIAGQRSYRVARARARSGGQDSSSSDREPANAEVPALPAPALVTAYGISIASVERDIVCLHLSCSAGFYVRSLAHDVGQALGLGGHLAALRRTATSGVTLAEAMPLEALEADGREAALTRMIPLERMLPGLAGVQLTDAGVEHVGRGRDVGPSEAVGGFPFEPGAALPCRLMSAAGHLVAIAEPARTPGLLHPVVVLV